MSDVSRKRPACGVCDSFEDPPGTPCPHGEKHGPQFCILCLRQHGDHRDLEVDVFLGIIARITRGEPPRGDGKVKCPGCWGLLVDGDPHPICQECLEAANG